jgi:hypothetical protein
VTRRGGIVGAVLVEVRDLSLLGVGIAIEAVAHAAPPARLDQHLGLDRIGHAPASSHGFAPPERCACRSGSDYVA